MTDSTFDVGGEKPAARRRSRDSVETTPAERRREAEQLRVAARDASLDEGEREAAREAAARIDPDERERELREEPPTVGVRGGDGA